MIAVNQSDQEQLHGQFYLKVAGLLFFHMQVLISVCCGRCQTFGGSESHNHDPNTIAPPSGRACSRRWRSGGEGNVFVVSFVAACCLVVQCILKLAALFLLTVAAHPSCDGASRITVSWNRSKYN